MQSKLRWCLIGFLVGAFLSCLDYAPGYLPYVDAQPVDAGQPCHTCYTYVETVLDATGVREIEISGDPVQCFKLGDIGRPDDAWLPIPFEATLDGRIRIVHPAEYAGRLVRCLVFDH